MKLEFETNTSTVPFVDNGFVNEVNFDTGSTEIMQMLRAGIKASKTEIAPKPGNCFCT